MGDVLTFNVTLGIIGVMIAAVIGLVLLERRPRELSGGQRQRVASSFCRSS